MHTPESCDGDSLNLNDTLEECLLDTDICSGMDEIVSKRCLMRLMTIVSKRCLMRLMTIVSKRCLMRLMTIVSKRCLMRCIQVQI